MGERQQRQTVFRKLKNQLPQKKGFYQKGAYIWNNPKLRRWPPKIVS